MIKKLLIGCISLSILGLSVSSCKKKEGDNNPTDTNNQNLGDLIPTTAGSWWRFLDNEGKYVVRSATGIDSLQDGYIYQYFVNTKEINNTTTPDFFAKFENKYFTLIDIDGTKLNYFRAIVVKDNPQLNETWLNTGTVNTGTMDAYIEIEGKVTGVNQSFSTNDTTFTNVVEVTSTLRGRPTISPIMMNCGTIKMWFVPGIGIIKQKYDINIIGIYTRNFSDSLVSYHIQP